MDRPRAHSVMQMRPPSQSTFFNVRASKLFQKVSAKFSRSPDPAHPATRDSRDSAANSANNSPYMRRSTYSMDGAAKPYMSQPMLGLTLSHIEDSMAEDSDGSARSSPAWSEGGNNNNNNLNLNTRRSEGNMAINPTAATRAPPRPPHAPRRRRPPDPGPPHPQVMSNQNATIPATPALTIPPHPALNLTPATPISPSSPPPNALAFATAQALLPSTGFAAALLPAIPAETDSELDGAAGDADPDRGRTARPLRRRALADSV
ncbi:hypothetical protein MVEN_00757600 [Mycena venus]|uniref:Uncharacterized protein n=1 Tax=Mycena venus TaxID=2733690 RepID=A0A8H7D665_9AGAR|nr:hypothetical protein MVEN_00757600 [Mycena venus]